MKNYVIIILLLTASQVFSQTNTQQIIQNLKDGALLVRLTTKLNTINAVKDKNPELAERIKQKQQAANLEIINAFTKSFSHCPVYYFYSENSPMIKKKEFKGVLMDSNMNELIEIPNLDNNYLIASFSYTKSDTITYYMNDYLGRNSETLNLERKEQRGHTGMSTGVDALVLFSPELIALQAPYPHYKRTFEHLPIINRSRANTVEGLQLKIEKYLHKVSLRNK